MTTVRTINNRQGFRRWSAALWMLSTVGLMAVVGWYAYDRWVATREIWFVAQCQQARDSRQWSDLLVLSEQWSNWNPRSGDAWLFRGEAARELGDADAAVEYLSRLPAEDEKATTALLQVMALEFGSLNRPAAAARTCETTLSRDPTVKEAQRRLVFYLAMTLQREKLIRQVRAAMRHGQAEVPDCTYLFLVDTLKFSNGVEQTRRWMRAAPGEEAFVVANAIHIA